MSKENQELRQLTLGKITFGNHNDPFLSLSSRDIARIELRLRDLERRVRKLERSAKKKRKFDWLDFQVEASYPFAGM